MREYETSGYAQVGATMAGAVKSAMVDKAAGPFDLASAAVNEVIRLEERVSILASRLAGWGGAPTQNNKEQPQRPGVFGSLEAGAARVLTAVAIMDNALSAIERELP